MAEGGGGQFDTTTTQAPRKRFDFRQLARKVTDGIKTEFGGDSRIPTDEIQDSTVAYVVYRYMRNPFRGNIPGHNPFTIADVMANAGYVTPFRNTDLRTKFPDVYFKFRDSLKNLSDQGVLQTEYMENPADHNERHAYFIPHDETAPQRQQKLQEIASQAQQINPKHYPMAF